MALAKEAGRCETPAISAPGLLLPKPGAKWMRQRSNLGEHRYVRQYDLSPRLMVWNGPATDSI
ncbi:hypothetical protein CK222_27105 [Mesorhizobium sp. WSM3866]|nr:hypothetical protein CK222_27105 [Mesorhizobium sp. WSM3866]